MAGARGSVVKFTGDGALATFDGPARAINCACAIRDAVDDLGLSVRAGLHTGEVEMADGDVHGIAVHIAARIMALAAPGEVLVSGAIPPLVLGSRIAFDDRGEPRIEGCAEPVARARGEQTETRTTLWRRFFLSHSLRHSRAFSVDRGEDGTSSTVLHDGTSNCSAPALAQVRSNTTSGAMILSGTA